MRILDLLDEKQSLCSENVHLGYETAITVKALATAQNKLYFWANKLKILINRYHTSVHREKI